MAVIYGKTNNVPITRKAIALGPREALDYTFDLEPWNIIKVGFIFSFVDPNSPQNAGASGTLSVSNLRDNAFIGLRRYDPLKFPIENNTPLVGWKTGLSANTNTFFESGSPFHIWTHRIEQTKCGVHHPNGTSDSAALDYFDTACNEGTTVTYSKPFVLYFEIVNKGLANQQVIVKRAEGTGSNDTTQAAIQSYMNNAVFTDVGTFPYNQSGTPYDLPNSMFFYLPWTTVVPGIHNIAVQKIA